MSNKTLIISIFVALVAIVASVVLVGGNSSSNNSNKSSSSSLDQTNSSQNSSQTLTSIASEIIKDDLVIGTGAEVASGDTATFHYLGTLQDGTKFDSSYDRGQPFSTTIGVGQVIKGWDQGIPGMKIGGKRKLTIPSSLGYGASGQGQIPPNSTLIFEVELLGVEGK